MNDLFTKIESAEHRYFLIENVSNDIDGIIRNCNEMDFFENPNVHYIIISASDINRVKDCISTDQEPQEVTDRVTRYAPNNERTATDKNILGAFKQYIDQNQKCLNEDVYSQYRPGINSLNGAHFLCLQ
ncbi:hypothetical protein AB9P05_00795 [Roseivirga sp. BDSF3-8]|uniref:hypothetical protein n=1 Tax=Roseivirga sp. BDSF3-8 TaxID=3241598 RepID=UPI00353196B1